MISEKEQDELRLRARLFIEEIRLEYKKMRLGDRDAEKIQVTAKKEAEGLETFEAEANNSADIAAVTT